jgi:hypothetical protein
MQILERKQLQDLEKQNDLYITHQQVRIRYQGQTQYSKNGSLQISQSEQESVVKLNF